VTSLLLRAQSMFNNRSSPTNNSVLIRQVTFL